MTFLKNFQLLTNKIQKQLKWKHYLILISIILIGAILRFCQLDSKPLGIDEMITALFSLGKSYQDVPQNILFPLFILPNLFQLESTSNCQEIADNIINQSTHPPLFFCLTNWWLLWLKSWPQTLVWKLRALPALFGIVAIFVIYLVNRIAFSPIAGLMGAALMAVSPLGVYFSQEARHYTLPILLVSLGLLGLIKIQKSLEKNQFSLWWFFWIIINGISFYVHYFCILGIVAQIITINLIILKSKLRYWWVYFGFSLTPFLLLIPWISIFLQHINNPKTSWLSSPENIAPIYQTIIAWLLMVIAFPIENQPVIIIIISGLLILGFGIWLSLQIKNRMQFLCLDTNTNRAFFSLSCFLVCVLIEFFAIVYFLQKDITIAPRYHFIYYPAICCLLGGIFVSKISKRKPLKKIDYSALIVLFIGVISSIFVVFNFAFQKPYHPELVVDNLNQSSDSLIMVMGYTDATYIALGLSYALELQQKRKNPEDTFLILIDSSLGYDLVWQRIAQISKLPKNLWVFAPGLKRIGYPQILEVNNNNCYINTNQYYRVGIPYQLYQCN